MEMKKCEFCGELYMPNQKNQRACRKAECKRAMKNKACAEWYRNLKADKTHAPVRAPSMSITEVCEAARACGVSYGQYVAMMGGGYR